jgi:hypothetical protein
MGLLLPTAPESLAGESGEARSQAGAAGGESPILEAKRKGRSEAEGCTSDHFVVRAEAWGPGCGAEGKP